jgi:hypothetical protein
MIDFFWESSFCVGDGMVAAMATNHFHKPFQSPPVCETTCLATTPYLLEFPAFLGLTAEASANRLPTNAYSPSVAIADELLSDNQYLLKRP